MARLYIRNNLGKGGGGNLSKNPNSKFNIYNSNPESLISTSLTSSLPPTGAKNKKDAMVLAYTLTS